ncbi:o-succinylbenzoate--CoA ligase [Blastococcus sp. Marseille-P5729]|uniref:o-succinylbenzoate--CoA ligase n=1 Tax=Blastococcus sp. Marseille-P5729 TaxID=2086582 RepID=UPI000D0EACB2|nr:o-succinylbenzoate--CoA ligase [Blastococcus sp. Marseille-P5729]
MPRRITPLPVSAPPTSEQIAALAAVLHAPSDCLLPVPDDAEGERVTAAARPREPLPEYARDAVLAVATTGSTGAPKLVLHSRRTLLASIKSMHARIGGPGQWLLCLGIHHIAGIQVALRSVVARSTPVVCPAGGAGFADDFTAAAQRLSGERRYVSLVPAQLQRLLDADSAHPTLRRFDAILLGGAAADPGLLARAQEAGAKVVTTYGSSETGGGCVYDGAPLDGVAIDITGDGVVRLAGPMVALGYRDRVDPDPFTARPDGVRSFTTSDLGEVDDGRLRVTGRADDVINTGGKKVSPLRVEHALRALPAIADAIVIGVPDQQWGQRIVALVRTSGGIGVELADLRQALGDDLATHELPREIQVVADLPYRGIGKPDRAAALRLAGGT